MPYNFIIVDDSTTARGMIKRILGMSKIPVGEVWEAENGREGLEKMRANWVDLVMADLNMPDMTGHEMIAAMADDPLLAKLPVMVISSEGNQTVLDSLVALGVKKILRKPFSPVELRDIVLNLLGTDMHE
jgi:two-component system chemotaxis response regulator CheY